MGKKISLGAIEADVLEDLTIPQRPMHETSSYLKLRDHDPILLLFLFFIFLLLIRRFGFRTLHIIQSLLLYLE
jgi:hypothetical protein